MIAGFILKIINYSSLVSLRLQGNFAVINTTKYTQTMQRIGDILHDIYHSMYCCDGITFWYNSDFMKTAYLLAICLCQLPNSFSQQYLIRYDLAAEEIRYLKVKKPGDTINASVIHLSQANKVNLQLVNLANSYQRQITLHEKTELTENVIIPGLGNASFQNLSSSLFKMDAGSLNADVILKSNAIPNKSIEETDSKILLASLSNQYKNFQSAYNKWVKAIIFEQQCTQLWVDLSSLRYNMQFAAPTIKNTAREKTQSIFPNLSVHQNPAELKLNIVNPQLALKELQKDYAAFKNSYQTLGSMGIQSEQLDSMQTQVDEKINAAKTTNTSFGNNNTDEIIQRITDTYGKIMEDSYTQLTALPVTRKTMMAEIKLIPKIDSITAAAVGINATDTIIKWVNIFKKEPMRFKNSFGFSFVSFAENRYNYFVKSDSTVARESGDYYQPLVGTFLHFYAPKDKGFRWGGSIGAGFPISGDDKQINIMLGLSSFLGKNDPVCISIGVAGSRTKKLSGVSIGEKVSSADYTLKYQYVYRPGYFMALSFNPAALNNKD